MIKVLIFDWHGVLDQTKFEGLVQKLAQLIRVPSEDVKELISPWERAYARGSNPKEFWDCVKMGLTLSDAKLSQAQNYILQIIPNDDLWKALPALASHYRLAILSDCPLDKVQQIRKLHLGCFEITRFSAEEGSSKSDDAFFLNLTVQMQVKPQDCLYIDDSQRHIETAQRLGFKTCLFESFANLEEALRRA